MELLQEFNWLIFSVGIFAYCVYADKGCGLGLNKLFTDKENGQDSLCAELFGDMEYQSRSSDDKKEISILKERIAILEKIITDPKQQLKREIDNL